MRTTIAITIAVLHGSHLAAADPPPVAWARAALASGKLRPWQKQWAQRIARGEYKQPVTVWVTNYGPWEGFAGDDYHIACNQLPIGTVVWLSRDRALKVVTNSGASSNDRAARHRGGAFWIDRWTRKPRHDNACQQLYVVGRVKWP